MNRIIKYFLCLLMILMLGFVNVYGETAQADNGGTMDCYYMDKNNNIISKIKFEIQGLNTYGVKTVRIVKDDDIITNVKPKNLNSNITIGEYEIKKIDNMSKCPLHLIIADNNDADIFVSNDKSEPLNIKNYYYKGFTDAYILNNIKKEELANSNSKVFGKLEANTCRDLLGGDLLKLINKYYGIVYVIVPILVIVLGMLDFGSAILQNSADEMKKNSKKFIKRLVMGIVVMILPTILNIMFYIVNFAKDPNSVDNYFNYINSDSCIDLDD